MINQKKSEAGYTLVGVLLIFTIVSFLGLSIVMLSLTSVKTSLAERDNQSAFYIAEAGLTYYMEEVKDKVNEIYERDTVKTEDDFFAALVELKDLDYDKYEFEIVDGHKPKAEVDVTLVDETDNQFKITSIGYIGDEKRTVEKTFSVEWEEKYVAKPYELPPLAVLTSGNITLTNGPVIGSIGTQSTDKSAITAGSGEKKVRDGEIYVPVIHSSDANKTCKTAPTNEYKSHSVTRPLNEDVVPCPIEKEEMWEIPELPNFPDFPKLSHNEPYNIDLSGDDKLEIQLNEDKEFGDITLTSRTTLIFDVGSSDREIVVDNFNIVNGIIKIKGSGKLTIYIKDDFIFTGESINEKSKFTQLNIFLKGHDEPNKNKKIELLDYVQVFGSLYAEDADIKFTGSAGFYGNIFTGGKKLELLGHVPNTSQLILAPYSKVTLTGSSNITGRIISKTFNHESAAKVKLEEPFILDGPISPSALGQDSDGESGGSGSTEEETGASPEIITIDPIREVRE